MKNVPHLFTLCSSWKTGRYFLSASLLLLLFCLFTPDLILRHIISPRADFSRNGWWMHFHEPSHPVGIEGYETFIPGGEPLALNPDFKKATGYLLWDVPVDGQYCFKLVAKENAVLAIDGKTTARLQGNHLPIQRIDTWVSLSKGQHLFQVQLDNNSGNCGFSVGMMVPPMMSNRLLQGTDVAVPALRNLDKWWLFLKVLHNGRTIIWFLTIFFSLSLLLPLTLKNRTASVLLTVAIALSPSLFFPVHIRREPYIGEMIHQELQEKRPDFVFIGNSMLWSRIDDAYLEQLLDGERVYSIVNFGGLSAIHYLSFKYLFLPANITPKKVFIFFRSNQFILPKMRTTDPLVQKTIQRLTPAPDPVFEQIVYGRSRSITDRVYDNLLNIFPVAAAQENIRRKINNLALLMASTWSLDGEPITQKQQHTLHLANKRFSFTSGSLRADIDRESKLNDTVKNTYDLHGRVEDSFLPHMLQLARDKNVSLVFIRVQERPSEHGFIPDPPELQTYMHDLQTYLTRHDAFLYDFTGDPELPLSAYHDGDHIKDQKKYTELFSRRVGDLLQ
jgi:hypothetical protein